LNLLSWRIADQRLHVAAVDLEFQIVVNVVVILALFV
jgi:hypothetical protein